MQPKELQRWMDAGPNLPEVLSEAVRAARCDGPTEQQLQRILERAATAPSAGTSTALPGSWSTFFAAGVVLLAAIATLWMQAAPRSNRPATPAQAKQHARDVHTVDASKVEPALRVMPAPPLSAASIMPDTRSTPPARFSRARTTSKPPPSAAGSGPGERHTQPAAPAADPTAEIRLLQAAQRDLARAPARAYQRLIEHEQRFQASVFVEEREALAVEALVRMGRATEARSRAQDFRRRFPNSAYWRRINAVLQTSKPL